MATWSRRRKTSYALFVLALFVIFVGIPAFKAFYVKPTCTDGIQNQNEQGVDCGGSCAVICSTSFIPAKTLWTRADKTADGFYNLGAYIVNRNTDAAVTKAPYIFKVYDTEGILIGERRGSVTIAPYRNVLAFEAAFPTGKKIPSRVTFEWLGELAWKEAEDTGLGLVIRNRNFTQDSTGPRIDAEIVNSTLYRIDDIELYVIMYDEKGNTLGFSKTVIDEIPRGGMYPAAFTWAFPRSSAVTTIEIIPIAPPRYTD